MLSLAAALTDESVVADGVGADARRRSESGARRLRGHFVAVAACRSISAPVSRRSALESSSRCRCPRETAAATDRHDCLPCVVAAVDLLVEHAREQEQSMRLLLSPWQQQPRRRRSLGSAAARAGQNGSEARMRNSTRGAFRSFSEMIEFVLSDEAYHRGKRENAANTGTAEVSFANEE